MNRTRILIAASIAAAGLALGGCQLAPPVGTETPAVAGHLCWHPDTGWQESPTGTCVYVGPGPLPTTTTAPPAPTTTTVDPGTVKQCLIPEGCPTAG